MNALVPVSPPMTVSDVERVALAIAKGGLFGSKDPNAVLTLCLLAQAEGQHPAVVFRDYHIISGKPAKKAEAMLRDFIQAGGKVEWHSLTDDCADATFTHPSGSARISWDHQRVQKAQLGNNGMYKKFPRQMLRSRVISEGIRTVYPGATSGLYEENEVAAFAPVEATATEVPHNPETGEVETHREPVKGITKIKQRLGKLLTIGNKIEADEVGALETFNDLVHENADDLTAIKEANHGWWTGDGDDFEGFKAWIKRRRAELAPKDEATLGFQMLLSALDQCATRNDLTALLDEHGAVAEALDGEESRRWEEAYNAREAAIMAIAPVSAG